MKKIILSLLLAGSLLTSCDMNNEPDGSIKIEDGVQSMLDVRAERNGIYSFLRARCGGGYIVTSDLQTDLFIGTMQNGNSYLAFTTGNILSNDGDIEGIWAGLYSGIMQTNYFLEYVGKYAEAEERTDAERAECQRYLAETHFARGYFYWLLTSYFTPRYDEATATQEATGVPLVDKYDPSGDRSKYPGRSTLQKTFKFIEDDLKAAYDGLKAFEETNQNFLVAGGNGYLNSYAVMALQARIALYKGENTTAETLSKKIIVSGLFPLTKIADYADMWTNDTGSELIFQPYGDASQRESVPATGAIFANVQPVSIKFSPAADVIMDYSDDDIRFSTFIGATQVNYNGMNIFAVSLDKYPGNPQFNSGNTSAQRNLPKPFRCAEQYLILAEAANALGHDDIAMDALNDLRKNRIEGYEDQSLTGANLRNAIREERVLELIGEGFRLSDLRRWKIGFTRDGNYATLGFTDMAGFILNQALNVRYTDGDSRYTWPIPSAEIQTNPQLKGQQNPGY